MHTNHSQSVKTRFICQRLRDEQALQSSKEWTILQMQSICFESIQGISRSMILRPRICFREMLVWWGEGEGGFEASLNKTSTNQPKLSKASTLN